MVKIRLRRSGNKHRPFYRIVVAKSTAGRGGSFIEVLGTYNPLVKPSAVTLDGDKALEWLNSGAQPTETVAYLLKREGVLERFLESRPNARKSYRFLDKRTAVMSHKTALEEVSAEAKAAATAEPTPAPAASEPEAAPSATPQPVTAVEAAPEPAASEAPVEQAPEAPAEEAE